MAKGQPPWLAKNTDSKDNGEKANKLKSAIERRLKMRTGSKSKDDKDAKKY